MTNRTKAIAGLASVFLLGCLCGALIFGVVIRSRVHDAQRLRDQDGFVGFFERRLQLSEAQRDSLHDELMQAYDQLDELRSNASLRYNEVIDTLKSHIYPQLTPEQRELFSAQETQFRKMMPREGRHHRPGGPFGGPGAPPNHGAPIAPPASEQKGGDSGRTSSVEGQAPSAKAAPTAPPAGRELADMAPGRDTSASDDQMLSRMRARFEQARARLHLSDEQVRQVRQIFDDTRGRVQQSRQELADQPMERRVAIKRSFQEMHRKIRDLLTDEQRQEFGKMREEMKSERRNGVAGGR